MPMGCPGGALEWQLVSEYGDQGDPGLERRGPHPMERVFEVGEVTKESVEQGAEA